MAVDRTGFAVGSPNSATPAHHYGELMLLQPFVIVAVAAFVNGEPTQLTTLGCAAGVVVTVLVGQQTSVRRK